MIDLRQIDWKRSDRHFCYCIININQHFQTVRLGCGVDRLISLLILIFRNGELSDKKIVSLLKHCRCDGANVDGVWSTRKDCSRTSQNGERALLCAVQVTWQGERSGTWRGERCRSKM